MQNVQFQQIIDSYARRFTRVHRSGSGSEPFGGGMREQRDKVKPNEIDEYPAHKVRWNVENTINTCQK